MCSVVSQLPGMPRLLQWICTERGSFNRSAAAGQYDVKQAERDGRGQNGARCAKLPADGRKQQASKKDLFANPRDQTQRNYDQHKRNTLPKD